MRVVLSYRLIWQEMPGPGLERAPEFQGVKTWKSYENSELLPGFQDFSFSGGGEHRHPPLKS